MSIQVTCDSCGAQFRVANEHAGKRAKCKECAAVLQIPDAPASPEKEESAKPSRPRRGSSGSSKRRRAGRGRNSEQPQPEDAMPMVAILAAAGAAIAGGAIWTALMYKADIQIGWIAVGIGAATGAAMKALGGRGVVAAAVAAGIAAVGIIGGQLAGLQLILNSVAPAGDVEAIARSAYESQSALAAEVAEAQPLSLEAAARIAANYEYARTEGMNEEELELIRSELLEFLPILEPGSWPPFLASFQEELTVSISLIEFWKETADIKDLLFILLGIGAAFGLVQRD